MHRILHPFIYFGDGAVLLPCAALVFVWLIGARSTRSSAWLWLLAALLVSGGVALSKMLYMVTGWHPAGWNFTGLSGHAALSFLFWPSIGALVTSRNKTIPSVVMVALGACFALAISASSWVLGDHSLSEVVVGATWGAVVAAGFLILTWRQVAEAPLARRWMIATILLLVFVAVGHEFPSQRVLSWAALWLDGHSALHTR